MKKIKLFLLAIEMQIAAFLFKTPKLRKGARLVTCGPAGVAYDPSAYTDRDGKAWYLKEVKSNCADLGTPDTFARAMVKMTTSFIDENPIEQVRDSAKRTFATKQGEQNIMYTIKIGQSDADTENFFRYTVKGKYYAVMLMEGISKYDTTLEKNLQKVKFFCLVRFEVRWNEDSPDGKEAEVKMIPLPNPTSSAIALSNVGTITGALTTADADNDLDSTAWEALDFSVAPGRPDQTLATVMTY